MKKLSLVFLSLSLLGYSCNTSLNKVFDRKTPHEKYEERIKDAGLSSSPEGREWLDASERSLVNAGVIRLPFHMQGYFHADRSRALGLRFTARRGEYLQFELKKAGDYRMYVDVFLAGSDKPVRVRAADTNEERFGFAVEESGDYIIRIQPEISQSGPYSLEILPGPLFDFPVKNGRVGSVWGDPRDGGKRLHEGIDIFAPKRSPVLAIADGTITAVKEGGLGGKTVNLRPRGMNYSLYYAHLDEQLVSPGQEVKKGDLIGLVGNTGNAISTPPHLHFGIYTFGGAVDPLPFVNPQKSTPAAPPSKPLEFMIRLAKTQKTSRGEQLASNSLLVPLGVTAKGYLVELPRGGFADLPFSSVKNSSEPVAKSQVVEGAYRLKSSRGN